MTARLGVVVPTLDEADALPRLLDDLSHLESARVVVADGGSSDATRALALDAGARVVRAPRGRARQMNAGAAVLDAPWLLFLHADSRLPPETRCAITRWLDEPATQEAAHFAFRLDAEGAIWRWIERGQRVREGLTGLAYGDQGLLLSRRRWEGLGGLPDLPIMEDVAAIRRLRRTGGIRRIPAPVVTSARRYREEGIAGAWLRHQLLLGLYAAGAGPARLAEWRRPHAGWEAPAAGHRARASRRRTPGRPPIVIVFAKAPRPGQVKTRLAADLGEEAAADLYRALGRRIVDRLRGGPYRVQVHFDPPDARGEVAAWLGESGLELRPQRGRDLGERMASAFEEAFRDADRACIVGTDIPDLTSTRVERALALVGGPPAGWPSVERPDAVFGPALDGGYYLLALRRPAPRLFEGISWSTPEVLEQSLARARTAGLAVHPLPALSDVDELSDLPPDLLPSDRATLLLPEP